ncbi:hypothetical protein CRG98_026773 [Punica granatum]|uniref:Uncharacterized protein n=1 Tax=Punica granatum TaxID=22663 RepID=A0A2I0J999_PUNGR|nr:hypothetical protein CRG98_026773 [Punica granatum]
MLISFSIRERVPQSKDESSEQEDFEKRSTASVATTLQSPPRNQLLTNSSENANSASQNGLSKPNYSARSLLKSASISASKCIGVQGKQTESEASISEPTNEAVDGLAQKVAALRT